VGPSDGWLVFRVTNHFPVRTPVSEGLLLGSAEGTELWLGSKLREGFNEGSTDSEGSVEVATELVGTL